MEDDQDMMETYDGSTESDDDRLLAPLGESYDGLVTSSPCTHVYDVGLCVVATCVVDQGQDERSNSSQNPSKKLVRKRRNVVSYSGNASCL